MKNNNFDIEQLKRHLTSAFYWMGSATASAKEGSIKSATFDITLAMQYWIDCMHVQDRYLNDVEGLDFHAMVEEAIENARKKHVEESENK